MSKLTYESTTELTAILEDITFWLKMANKIGVRAFRTNFYSERRGLKLKFDMRDWKLSVASTRLHMVLPFSVYNHGDPKYYLHNSDLFLLPNDRVYATTLCRLYLPPEEVEEYLITTLLSV